MLMSKFVLAFAAALSAIAVFARPSEARQGGDIGIGFQIGEPRAALSGKLWTGSANAIDMALAFSTDHDWIMLQADYLWHHFNVIPVGAGQFPLYYGIGGTAWVSGDPGIGVQGVVGLAYHFPAAPLDIFLDLSPGVVIIPNPDDNIGVALGMRFFF